MSDKSETDITEWVRGLATARGLDRALTLYPETMAAAVARGTTALSPQHAALSPLTDPAAMFDPEKFAGES
jgi:hypothetical protein